MAIALNGVDFAGDEKFGIGVSYGTFKGAQAIGISLAAVLGTSIITPGDRLALSGGMGYVVAGSGAENMGGRVGLQLTW